MCNTHYMLRPHGLSHKLSFTSLQRATILIIETEPINIFLKNTVEKYDDFLNSCYDCIIVTIYCQIFDTI